MWVQLPQILVPLRAIVGGHPVLRVSHIPATTLVVVLTPISIHLLDSTLLLKLASHERGPEQIETHGLNTDVKVRLVDSDPLAKVPATNLFVLTDNGFLLVYLVLINYSKSTYEVYKGDELVQNSLPLADTSSKSSLKSIIQSATRQIIGGAEPTLENPCHFRNDPAHDDALNTTIPAVELHINRTIKVTLGLRQFWLKANSHTLIIYTHTNLQVVNLKSNKLDVLLLLDEWADITALEYDPTTNVFVLVTAGRDVWTLALVRDDLGVALHSEKVLSLGSLALGPIVFSPKSPLVAVVAENAVVLVDRTQVVTELNIGPGLSLWSPCGQYFLLHNKHWSLHLRLGTRLFSSKDVEAPWLEASHISFAPNSQTLLVLANNTLHNLHLVRLINGIFVDHQYLGVRVQNHIVKVPLPAKLQAALLRFDYGLLSGAWTAATSAHHQVAVVCGNDMAVSTPFTDGRTPNHVLWYNFHNLFVEPLNIVRVTWFQDFLVVVNRSSESDEVVVLDVGQSKYGLGGGEFKFDSDVVVWRHDFDAAIVTFLLANKSPTSHLVLVTDTHRIVTVEFSTADKKISIGIKTSIQLASIKHRLALELTQDVAMVDEKHFVFLLTTGQVFLLRNQELSPDKATNILKNTRNSKSNMYDLIAVDHGVESMQVTHSFTALLALFKGTVVLVYDIRDLLDKAVDPSGAVDDGLPDDNEVAPIEVETIDAYPLSLTGPELIGVEATSNTRNGVLIFKQKLSRQLILNHFIETDLYRESLSKEQIVQKYGSFPSFAYCLELILFKHITSDTDSDDNLRKITTLIEDHHQLAVFVNCLRKIEIGYWHRFFDVLDLTPVDFMNRLIESQDEELCYNFLIVYLNFKREFEDEPVGNKLKSPSPGATLDGDDHDIILKIITMLAAAERWHHCFELCRFIKLLEPTSELLTEILTHIESSS